MIDVLHDGSEYESEFSVEEALSDERFALPLSEALDRTRAYKAPMRDLFVMLSQSDKELSEFNTIFEKARDDFKAAPASPHVCDIFNVIADRHYYDLYYAPEVFANSLIYTAYELLEWSAKHLLHFNPKDTEFGKRIDFFGNPSEAGVTFGNVLRALRNHAAHFEEWVDDDVPSKWSKQSWLSLGAFGYPIPLGNASIVPDALWRISLREFDVFMRRIRGGLIDLCVRAREAGAVPIDAPSLRARHDR